MYKKTIEKRILKVSDTSTTSIPSHAIQRDATPDSLI